jgi:hypothetical protein
MAINLNRSRRKKKMTVVTGGSANLTKREPMARETVGWIAGRRRWQHRLMRLRVREAARLDRLRHLRPSAESLSLDSIRHCLGARKAGPADGGKHAELESSCSMKKNKRRWMDGK